MENNADDMEEDTTTSSAAAQRSPDTVSELGALALAMPSAGPAALYTVS